MLLTILFRLAVFGLLILTLAVGVLIFLTVADQEARFIGAEMVIGGVIVFSFLLRVHFWG